MRRCNSNGLLADTVVMLVDCVLPVKWAQTHQNSLEFYNQHNLSAYQPVLEYQWLLGTCVSGAYCHNFHTVVLWKSKAEVIIANIQKHANVILFIVCTTVRRLVKTICAQKYHVCDHFGFWFSKHRSVKIVTTSAADTSTQVHLICRQIVLVVKF